jgi:hypothetical protein
MDPLQDLVHDRGELGQAWFSVDREHRYLLLRGGEIYADTPLIAFFMLNPSTADADQNDPTIAKCLKFAAKFAAKRRWETPRVAIANLFAVRSTDPDFAFRHPRPVGGTKNDDVILGLARISSLAIAAWGADKRSSKRAREVYRLLRDHVVLHRLGCASKDGSPKHPLYLRDATELEVHSW